MKFLTIDEARKNIHLVVCGDRIAFATRDGVVRIGTVRFKKAKVEGLNIAADPQPTYVYAQYRAGEKVSDQYIGKQL